MILCVDIGGTGTKVALVSPQGALGVIHSLPTQPPADQFLDKLASVIVQTRAESPTPVTQIGMAVAGFLNEERSQLLYNSNLSWLERFPLRAVLEQHLPGITIELEVDSNAAALAESRFGSGQKHDRFLCLACGTGLGVGMIIHGAPLRFAYGCLGDMGHIIVQRDGPVCTCGGRGCAESLLSSSTLARQYAETVGGSREITLRHVIESAFAGDRVAAGILAQAGEWLGVAMASLANTFFPDHIAVAGGLSAAGNFVLEPAEKVFRQSASYFAQSRVSVSPASLGASATLIGAAWPFFPKSDPDHHG